MQRAKKVRKNFKKDLQIIHRKKEYIFKITSESLFRTFMFIITR